MIITVTIDLSLSPPLSPPSDLVSFWPPPPAKHKNTHCAQKQLRLPQCEKVPHLIL